MHIHRPHPVLATLIVAAVSLSVAAAAAAQSAATTATDLGTLGGNFGQAHAVNDDGLVVGQSSLPGNAVSHATLWQDGVATDLGSLCVPGPLFCFDYSVAWDVNAAGVVVGESGAPGGYTRAVAWENGVITELPIWSAGDVSYAFGINDAGRIVGAIWGFTGQHAVLWEHTAAPPIDLGLLPAAGGIGFSQAIDINDAGAVVGVASGAFFESRAFVWTAGGGMVALDTPGSPGCGFFSYATGINAAGEISGYALVDCVQRAVKWTNGTLVDLGTINAPFGASGSYHHGINDQGDVSGFSTDGCNFQAAFFSGGTIVPLGSPTLFAGCPIGVAYGSNNAGQVAGYAYSETAFARPVLWSTAPPDADPPVITVTGTTSELWPANGRTVPVAFTGTIVDEGSGIASATYELIDEYGQLQPSGAITVDPNGNYSVVVSIESRRNGNDRDGRSYTLVVTAVDENGNTGSASATTVVLHDRR